MRHCLLLFLFMIIACDGHQADEITIGGEAFGTTYAVKYFGKQENARSIQKGIDSVIYAVNKSMSTYSYQSDISKINRGDTTVVVDEMFRKVFTLSRKINMHTNGYFDPTIGGLRNAYGFGDTKPIAEIDSIALDSMMQYVGFDKVTLSPKGKIKKAHPEVYIDFNAVAKGYGIDRIALLLDGRGIQNYLIELGGEISARGINQNSKSGWSVGVESTESKLLDRSATVVVELQDKTMASSGNYRKNRIDQLTGKEYVHTINPLTGSAEKSDVLGATIIASDCATADAWATACMAMGLELSKEILARQEGIEAYLIYDGGVFATEEFERLIKN